MPVAAFPFQFYPEMVAGVLVLLVAGYAVFPPEHPGRARLGRSFVYGLLAGYLPWLHVRFGGVAVVLALASCVALRRDTQQASGFALGFAVALGCLGLYVYRITGSVIPTALWYSEGGGSVLSLAGAVRGSVGYLVDRDWGLLAHAPVYLLALPGYWLVARRRLDVACICALSFFALLLPAAGHTLHAAGTTPTRLIVAVVPLAAVPLAELLARFGSRRPLQVVFGLLLVLSMHNALAYNAHHLKHVGMMVDRSFSGWQASLLFPSESRFAWEVSVSNGWLAVVWLVVLLTLLAAPGFIHLAQARGWRVPRSGIGRTSSWGRGFGSGCSSFALSPRNDGLGDHRRLVAWTISCSCGRLCMGGSRVGGRERWLRDLRFVASRADWPERVGGQTGRGCSGALGAPERCGEACPAHVWWAAVDAAPCSGMVRRGQWA